MIDSVIGQRSHGKDFLIEICPPLGSPHQAPQRRLENPGIGDPRKLAPRPTLDFVCQDAKRQSDRAVGPDDRSDRLKELRSALRALSRLPGTRTPHGPVLPTSCRSDRGAPTGAHPAGTCQPVANRSAFVLPPGLHVSTRERALVPRRDDHADQMARELSAVVPPMEGEESGGQDRNTPQPDDRVESGKPRAAYAGRLWKRREARLPEVRIEREGLADSEVLHEDKGSAVREGPWLVRSFEEKRPCGVENGRLHRHPLERGRIEDRASRRSSDIMPTRLEAEGGDGLVEHVVAENESESFRAGVQLTLQKGGGCAIVSVLPVEPRHEEARVDEGMLHLSACRTGPDRACARPWGRRRTRSTGRRMDRPSGLDAFPQRPALGGHGSEGRIRRGERPHSLVRFSGWTVSGGWLGPLGVFASVPRTSEL